MRLGGLGALQAAPRHDQPYVCVCVCVCVYRGVCMCVWLVWMMRRYRCILYVTAQWIC
jgi:hypothetical protein